ncbi:hypothetical protein MPSEU_000370100 [Mayamaea pseudoterrestris]|nr:hypothetical protein MPSEU_000370100 [Mayamaea pseudoterrestris]
MVPLTDATMRLVVILIMLQVVHSQSKATRRRRLEFLKEYSFFKSDPQSATFLKGPDNVYLPVPLPASNSEPTRIVYIPIWPVGEESIGSHQTKSGSKSVKGSKGKLPPLPPVFPGKGFPTTFQVPAPVQHPTIVPTLLPTLRNPAGQPVFILAQPSAGISSPVQRPTETREPSVSGGQEPSEPPTMGQIPTANQATLSVFNSFIVGNQVGLTAADIEPTGSEPGASNAVALEESYAAYVANQVEDYANTLSQRPQRGREQSTTTVTLVDGSATISQLGDVPCPTYYRGDCQIVCANFEVRPTGDDASKVEADLLIETQRNILDLNDALMAADPNALIEVLRAAFPVQPCLASPTTGLPFPTPVTMPFAPGIPPFGAPMASPFAAPLASPSQPVSATTRAPSQEEETTAPTTQVTEPPSAGPTSQPTERPSFSPSLASSESVSPTSEPTDRPSFRPSSLTIAPTTFTAAPTPATDYPSTTPSITPSTTPSAGPSTPVLTVVPTSFTGSPSFAPSATPFTGSLGPTLSLNPSISSAPTNLNTSGPPATVPSIDTRIPSSLAPSSTTTPSSLIIGTNVPTASAVPSARLSPTSSSGPTSLGTALPTMVSMPTVPTLTAAPTTIDSSAGTIPTTSPQPTSMQLPTTVPLPSLTARPTAAIATELPVANLQTTSSRNPTGQPSLSDAPSLSTSPLALRSATVAGQTLASNAIVKPVNVNVGIASATVAAVLMVAVGILFLHRRRKGEGNKQVDIVAASVKTDDQSSSFFSGDDESNENCRMDCLSDSTGLHRATTMGGRSILAPIVSTARMYDERMQESDPYLFEMRTSNRNLETRTSILTSVFSYAFESAKLLESLQAEDSTDDRH